jgi:membrane protein YdbS with pleckstrin-like domain
MSASPPVAPMPEPPPKYLRAAYLAPGEAILRESRATLLYYLPGPVAVLLLLGILDYSAASAGWSWSPFPLLTSLFAHLLTGSVGGHSVLYWVAAFFGLLTAIALLWLAFRYLLWIRTVYAVTTSRVIVQRGILSRDFDEIPVAKIRAIDVHQSPGQRLLGYGTVRITSEGENPIANEAWRGMPKPWEFQKLADAAAQRYLQR